MVTEHECPECLNGVIMIPWEANDDDEVACDFCGHFLSAGDARALPKYEEG